MHRRDAVRVLHHTRVALLITQEETQHSQSAQGDPKRSPPSDDARYGANERVAGRQKGDGLDSKGGLLQVSDFSFGW